MIAGEGIAGILLAVLAILKITPLIDMSWLLEENMSFANSGSIILLSLIIFAVLKQTVWSREENEE